VILGVIFKIFGIAFIVVFIVFYAAAAFRKSRLLDQRIREFKAEQEELRKSGKVMDPYAELAQLYSETEKKPPRPDTKKSRRAPSKFGPWS
jgi:hypothetical protein